MFHVPTNSNSMEQKYSDADISHVVKGFIASFGIFFKEDTTESLPQIT
jgi:hypothetical protein